MRRNARHPRPRTGHGLSFSSFPAAHCSPCRADGRRQECDRQAVGASPRPALCRRRRRDRACRRLLDLGGLRALRRDGVPRRRTEGHLPPACRTAACTFDRRRRLHGPRDARPDGKARHHRMAARRPRGAVRPGPQAHPSTVAARGRSQGDSRAPDQPALSRLCRSRSRGRVDGPAGRDHHRPGPRSAAPPSRAAPRWSGSVSQRIVRVSLAGRSYDIAIGPGLIDRAGELSAGLLKAPRVIVVTDETVAPLYGERLVASFKKAGATATIVTVPAGESSKEFAAFGRLMNVLLDQRPDRKATLVALGGGVVGDLTGFAAASLLRGVEFIQVPTTLLAQVDSSVGGKTGIDTPQGKNLVGAFHQPRLVLADTAALDSLPRRQMLAGYAEVAKYGLINDPQFFTWLESNGVDVIERADGPLRHAVLESCRSKAKVVAM